MRREAPLPYPPAPQVLTETPSAQDVIGAVNRTSAIQKLSTNSSSVEVLSWPSLPPLTSSTINLQREKNFRLKAKIPLLLGSGLDMGSNDQQFWFEVPEGVSRTLYHANHDAYRTQMDRAILPVDPSWLMDALGLVQIDPNTIVAGPVSRPDGKLEVRNTINTPTGTYQRVCFIDAAGGFVTDQFLYSPTGALIANSAATDHRFYEDAGCVLPHSVTLRLQPNVGPALALKIEVGSYAINQFLSGDPNLFVMPKSASKAIDLTQLQAVAPGNGTSVSATPPMPASSPAASPIGTTPPVHYTSSNRLGPMPLRGTVRVNR